MEEKITQPRRIRQLSLLFAVMYMVSYITRINYGAIVSEMEQATGFSKSTLSMALTGTFISYGIGQLISGLLGDRIPPKRLILLGLGITAFMNTLLPFCPNAWWMLGVWCINGLAQSFLWPPLVKLMSLLFTHEGYKCVSTRVTWGTALGTVSVYLVSPLLISLSSWKTVFWWAALCAVGMMFLWQRFCPDPGLPKAPSKETPCAKESVKGRLITPVLGACMVAIALHGTIKDGVATWIPSYISETYRLDNVISILTGVVMPCFSVLCVQIFSPLYRKKLTNPFVCAVLAFGIGTLACGALLLFNGQSAWMAVVLASLFVGCMHGVNLMLVIMLPAYFEKQGNVSTVSGILNACTYVGSAVSTFGIAVLVEDRGWGTAVWLWFAVALTGTAILCACIRPWKRRCEKED